ncbi:Asp-tRNA(Asn)/Glu-tRNA(Gln) amidotransferase subunit GatB [Candidatus Woesearchaeota archaeon]|nr:Asp-tRNA(Asn)/Glu-tRNA(Gln) amidotransferase subunit GatB [Candidatus Woesearchaeota archaeon]
MVEAKIGFELHVYIDMNETKKKLFCNCSVQEAEPNTNICPVCTGQPGNKPMLPNKEAVDKTIKAGLMLNCKLNHDLLFQRKHYSWPDLPNGYQKTMSGSYSVPVGEHGSFMGIGIREIHLEEDPARWDPVSGKVDYNRCGFPLIEIVTEPDFKSSSEVREWIKKLLRTLSYVKAVDKTAGIKSDVNVSIAPSFNRVEIKNVNSLKSIVKAIEYEIARQQEEPVKAMETRTWDEEKTVFMRAKETLQQYMFIPEPDLPVVKIDDSYISNIQKQLPEKPEEKIEKYVKLGVAKEDAAIISSERLLAELFEKVAKEIDAKLAAKWLRRELLRVMHYSEKEMEDLKIDAKHIIELLKMVESKQITETTAQKILEKLIESPFSPKDYVEKEQLGAIAGEEELKKLCEEAVKENPSAVDDYKKGEEKALNFIVGKVMQKTKGKADPAVVNRILKEIIK